MIKVKVKGRMRRCLLRYALNRILSVAELTFLQIKCELCSKTFASKNSVRKHKRSFHKIRTFASEVRIMTQGSWLS